MITPQRLLRLLTGAVLAFALSACAVPQIPAAASAAFAAPVPEEVDFGGPLRPIPQPFQLRMGFDVRLICIERQKVVVAEGQVERTRRWMREQRETNPPLVLKFLEDSAVTAAIGTPDRPLYEASAGLFDFRLVGIETKINIPLADDTQAEVSRFLRTRLEQSITYPQRVAQDETVKRGDNQRTTPLGLTTMGGRDAVVFRLEDRLQQPGAVRLDVRGFTVTDLASGADLQSHHIFRFFGSGRNGLEAEVSRLDSKVDCTAETL